MFDSLTLKKTYFAVFICHGPFCLLSTVTSNIPELSILYIPICTSEKIGELCQMHFLIRTIFSSSLVISVKKSYHRMAKNVNIEEKCKIHC